MQPGLKRIARKALPYVGAGIIALGFSSGVACGKDIGYTPVPTQTPTAIYTLTPTPTPPPDQYELFLLNNPEASEGFTKDERELALEHLVHTPEVMNEPELWEAFNAKVKIEEDLLKDLNLFPPSEADWDEIILANWSDVYDRLYRGGEAYGSIAQSELAERLPDEKDREMYYMGLWVPKGLKNYRPLTDWGKWLSPDMIVPNEAVPVYYDMGSDSRRFVVENLKSMSILAPQIMQAYNNPDLFLQQRARECWESIPYDSFPITCTTLEEYVGLYELSGDKEIDLARFVHGLTTSLYGGDLISIDEILCKSVGLVIFEQRAPYGHGIPEDGKIFTHGEPAIVVPENILDEIRANPDEYGTPIVFGHSIGWVPNIQCTGKSEDDIPYVAFYMPNGITIIRLDENYDLTTFIQQIRHIDTNPQVLEREDLE